MNERREHDNCVDDKLTGVIQDGSHLLWGEGVRQEHHGQPQAGLIWSVADVQLHPKRKEDY